MQSLCFATIHVLINFFDDLVAGLPGSFRNDTCKTSL